MAASLLNNHFSNLPDKDLAWKDLHRLTQDSIIRWRDADALGAAFGHVPDKVQALQEVAKFESALKSKEDEISFLCGHVSQLTQSIGQLALPPSQEEAKKKGWWRFWR